MKTEFDKEIEALLRESARRGRAGAGGDRARHAAATAHLDADEQSAYAENALPAAARAQYTAHLADCDDCRRDETRLALAAGMPAQLEAREATTAGQALSVHAGWRERLGALFAPRAWRYAAPALALLLVGAVALIGLRGNLRDGATSIARHDAPESKRETSTHPETHHAPQNGNAAPASTAPGAADETPETAAPNAQNTNAPPLKEDIAANRERTAAGQPPTGTAVNAPVAPAGAGGGSGAMRDASALPAPTPAPVVATAESSTITSGQGATVNSAEAAGESSKPRQRPGDFGNRQYENRRREQIQSGPRRNEQAQNRSTADAQNRDYQRDGELAAPTAAPAPPAAKRSRRDEGEKQATQESEARASSMPAAEARTVAGRKFIRQGGAWVDTAYRAGQSYTIVRRNSEQFRALVADEPQLRRVADALGGEVTVVWKGRAYRFR